jgi:hypothetical protein
MATLNVKINNVNDLVNDQEDNDNCNNSPFSSFDYSKPKIFDYNDYEEETKYVEEYFEGFGWNKKEIGEIED